MEINIYQIIENTRVEGPGNRTCIFVQGCLKGCDECNSKQTWNLNGGKVYDIKTLADTVLSNPEIEGVTFSGGEPFLQSRKLYQLASILRKENLSIVIFTGYTYNIIRKVNDSNWNKLLEVTDLLISGEYDANNKTYDKIWVGSANQEHHFLTDRYRYLENSLSSLENRIEVRLNRDGTLIVNGMGDNKKIREMFADIYDK